MVWAKYSEFEALDPLRSPLKETVVLIEHRLQATCQFGRVEEKAQRAQYPLIKEHA